MSQELLSFLTCLDRYVRAYPGPVWEAFHLQAGDWRRFWPEGPRSRLLRRKRAGDYLFHNGQPLDSVYILLEGACCVEKYKQSGEVFTDSSRRPLQMFGLLEGIAGMRSYTATMRCGTDCVYIEALTGTCLGKEFPVTVHLTKEELASGLNLNLRTVYRYLARLYEEGLLSSVRGKIVITREQHRTMERCLREP